MAEKSPLVGAARGVTPIGVPSAGLSLGWMLASRANLRFARRESDNVRAPRRQDQSRVAGQEAWQECSEGMPIFCPKNGVHFSPCGGVSLHGPDRGSQEAGARHDGCCRFDHAGSERPMKSIVRK